MTYIQRAVDDIEVARAVGQKIYELWLLSTYRPQSDGDLGGS